MSDRESTATGQSEADEGHCFRGDQQTDGHSETEDAGGNQASCSAQPLSFREDRELVGEFIVESRDHLTQVELQMITLESAPEDAEAINTVFRAFHTIKGLAGFLALNDIREVAHETETLLDLARNHKLSISSEIVDVVLAAADFLKACLLRLEQGLPEDDLGAGPGKTALLDRIHRVPAKEEVVVSPAPEGNCQAAVDDAVISAKGEGEPARLERRSREDRRSGDGEAHLVKIDTAKLDYLFDLAGEMVIAECMVHQHPDVAALRSPAVSKSLAHLARVTSDLQKTVMSMRMVPIGGLFQKMNRLVRDLSRKTGKCTDLEIVGADTELDRNVVEELSDALMHMVRNAIDHGLETEHERIAAGKRRNGRIRLCASHHAGHIVIEIADDGRGLNRKTILEKARRMDLVEDVQGWTDAEVFDLIFHPGFSTATEVTEISGRGVGMDVVKKKIQKLRGRVEIQSSPGHGTSFFLRVPLTLAMIDGLIVGVGRERYVIPVFSVREMLRPSAEMVFTVEGREEMVLVRNKLMPIVRLYRRFGVKARSEDPAESLLIVAEAAGRSFCLMVDDLIGKQQVVMKSLGETIKDISGISGGAILADGRVGLILDLEGICHGRAS